MLWSRHFILFVQTEIGWFSWWSDVRVIKGNGSKVDLTWNKIRCWWFNFSDCVLLDYCFFNMTKGGYTIKRYNRRWINLILFVIYAINNAIHCNQYTVINDSISKYYNVPHAYVIWTSGIFSLTYVIFFAPVLYGMEKIVSFSRKVNFPNNYY